MSALERLARSRTTDQPGPDPGSSTARIASMVRGIDLSTGMPHIVARAAFVYTGTPMAADLPEWPQSDPLRVRDGRCAGHVIRSEAS